MTGRYDVFVAWGRDSEATMDARFTVKHAKGRRCYSQCQRHWYPKHFLGTFELDAGSEINMEQGTTCVRTRGAQGPHDPIRHPELLPTNEYSKIAYLISKPIGPARLVDGTAEDPIDLGFVDVPESRFDPWPYYMRYVHQAWIAMPKLFEFRRAGVDKPLGMKPYRVGSFSLKPDARLKELMP